MSSDDLTKTQARKLSQSLFPGINFLRRLQVRMEKSGFPGDDELYLLVCKAYQASWELSIELHSMSASGVGRPPRPDGEDS